MRLCVSNALNWQLHTKAPFSHMRESDRQLVVARREEAEMESSLRNSARDKGQFVLKSEHEPMLKKKAGG